MTISKHIKEHSILGPFATAAGLAAHEADVSNPHIVTADQVGLTAHIADLANPHVVTAAQLGLSGPMDFKGGITIAADFPTLAAVGTGDVYTILADVTDNDATKTNTGDIFYKFEEIVWDGSGWINLGNSTQLLGSFATNKLALANLKARKLDTNGDGTGNPVVSQSYYNTTVKVIRTWDGTIWKGRPFTSRQLSANVTINWDNAAGSDEGGDGSPADPYLTLEQCIQDVSVVPNIEILYGYIVQCVGAGPYNIDLSVLNGLVSAYKYSNGTTFAIHGESSVVGTAFPVGVNGILTISSVVTDARGGIRKFNIVGGGAFTPKVYRGHKVVVHSCAATPAFVGAVGWVYDNDASGFIVEFDSSNFGSLAAGDELAIHRYPTTGRFKGDSINYAISAQVQAIFKQFEWVPVGPSLLHDSVIQFQDCIMRRTGNWSFPTAQESGYLKFKNVYFKNEHASTINDLFAGLNGAKARYEGACVFDAYDGAATRPINGLSSSIIELFGRLVITGVSTGDISLPYSTRFSCDRAAFDGNYILCNTLNDLFSVFTASESGKFEGHLPAVFGTLTGYIFNVSAANAAKLRGTLEFREVPTVVTAGATVGRCSIGSANGYIVRNREGETFKVLGTGNLNRIKGIVADYTITDNDGVEFINADATAAGVIATLPTAADNEDRYITVKKIDTSVNTVTIDGEGAETIDGAATVVISARYQSYTVVSNGTSWSVV